MPISNDSRSTNLFAKTTDELLGTISKVTSELTNRADVFPAASRVKTIKELLKRFKSFSEKQFITLINELPEDGSLDSQIAADNDRLSRYKQKYSIREHIVGNTLARLARDQNVFRTALEQRAVASLFLSENADSFRNILVDADWLALAALSMFEPQFGQPSSSDDSPTALCYFRSGTNVRLIPYAPVCLIGIPSIAQSYKVELLAIPHEVAHFFFWNGWRDRKQGFQTELEDHFDQVKKPNWPTRVRNWIEEIFADTVGCFIGGPIVGLSMQRLMLEYIGNDFTYKHQDYDNEVHPTPSLRPFIYSHVLEQIGLGGPDDSPAEKLRTHWANIVNTRLGEGKADQLEESPEWKAIQSIVDAILPRLPHLSDDLSESERDEIIAKRWSQDVNPDDPEPFSTIEGIVCKVRKKTVAAKVGYKFFMQTEGCSRISPLMVIFCTRLLP
ncbi:hypothetical protein KFU94_15860 [Chloroflexi bacterium TSY]|nr:hypothetical protein [Chloroflexi bacterium TSY]